MSRDIPYPMPTTFRDDVCPGRPREETPDVAARAEA